MKNLLVPRSDIGYFFLLIDMAMTPDEPDQMEIDFNENKEDESEKYFTNTLMLEEYL